MLQSLKEKIAPLNKIVSFYQRGLLSENEFQKEMAEVRLSEKKANDILGGVGDWPEKHGSVETEDGWEV